MSQPTRDIGQVTGQVIGKCVKQSLQECNTYRCQVGTIVGATPNNIEQAKRICEMFPGVEGCVAEQACSAYFPMSTSMYKSCNRTTQCIENQTQ
jgi:hypothetical protein